MLTDRSPDKHRANVKFIGELIFDDGVRVITGTFDADEIAEALGFSMNETPPDLERLKDEIERTPSHALGKSWPCECGKTKNLCSDGKCVSAPPTTADVGELADVLMGSLKEAGYVIGLAAALHVASAVRYRSARSTTRRLTDERIREIAAENSDFGHSEDAESAIRAALAEASTPSAITCTGAKVKCDYPRCGKAESRCGVCDYPGEAK